MSRFGISTLPSDVLESTAIKVKAIRKQLHLSQQELASKSGVSLGSLKRFESSGQISFESLLKIAHALNRLEDFVSLFELRGDPKNIKKLFDNP